MFIYSDLNALTPTDKPLLTDIEAVYQALFNIFSTRKKERLFLPDFGIDLEDELFELIDDITGIEILRATLEAVQRWESRVLPNTGLTLVIPVPAEQKFDLNLVFNIRDVEGQNFNFRGSFTK